VALQSDKPRISRGVSCRLAVETQGVAVRLKWLLVGLFCLLSARSTAAGEPQQGFSDVVERATRPSRLKGLGEPINTSVKRVRSEPSRLPDLGFDLAQPVNPPPTSRHWFLRNSVLVGIIAGATVGGVSAIAGDNNLFCRGGSDESCALYSPGLKVIGVGVFAALGGVAGYLVGVMW
jgi:hypothetical protein